MSDWICLSNESKSEYITGIRHPFGDFIGLYQI